jgi:hypothetical protein
LFFRANLLLGNPKPSAALREDRPRKPFAIASPDGGNSGCEPVVPKFIPKSSGASFIVTNRFHRQCPNFVLELS